MKPSYTLVFFASIIYLYQRGNINRLISEVKRVSNMDTPTSGGGGSNFDKR